MEKPWLSHYPKGVAAEVDVQAFASLRDVLRAGVVAVNVNPSTPPTNWRTR